MVNKGHIKLEGTVTWQYQRERAVSAVAKINGVIGVTNNIGLAPSVSTADIKHKIEEAFRRSATIDASHVVVDANGSEVILRGEVRSWAERDQAQASAWFGAGGNPGDQRAVHQNVRGWRLRLMRAALPR